MTAHMKRQPEPEVMDDQAEAEAYALADFVEVNQAFVDRLLEIAGPIPKADAVDLGAGPADIPIRVVRARPGWRVTAVDASPAMLQWAKKNIEAAGLTGSISRVFGDAKNTHLEDAAFDIVFSNSILHHITDTDALWREVKRIARPGAIVFMRDLARPADTDAARALVKTHAGGESDLLRKEYYRSLLSAYTPEEVVEQLARNNLGSLKVVMATDRHLDIYGRLR